MPTVFTSQLWEKDQSFEDFITKVASYFAKDDTGYPSEIPLPNKTTFSNYYIIRLTDAIEGLKTCLNELSGEKAKSWGEFRGSMLNRYYDERCAYLGRAERLSGMLKSVQGWSVPDTLKEVKDLAVKELEKAIEVDREPTYPSLPSSAEEWHALRVEGFCTDIKYYAKHLEEEVARVRETNKFLQDFNQAIQALNNPLTFCWV